MTLRKLALLLGVLLSASMAHAQDYAFYDINVCNSGKLTGALGLIGLKGETACRACP